MKRLFNNDNLFVLLTIFAAIVGLSFLSVIEKGDEVLWFNANNNAFADWVFRVITLFGEIYFIIPAIAFVWWKKGRENALLVIFAMLDVGVVVQGLKRLVFSHLNRPAELIGKLHSLRTIDGVEALRFHSFPSGHTAGAFALMFLLSFIFNSRSATVFFFLLALLTGISRMYLMQHFLSDVVAGALIGVSVAWIINRYFADRIKRISKKQFNHIVT